MAKAIPSQKQISPPSLERINFNKKILTGLTCPVNAAHISYCDTKISTLTLVIAADGSKSFWSETNTPDQKNSILLGHFPQMSVEQARIHAAAASMQIATASAPTSPQTFNSFSSAITFGALSQLYIQKYARPRFKRPSEFEDTNRRHFGRWQEVPLTCMKRSGIQEWMDDLAANHGKALANRCHDDMRAMLNWAIRMDYLAGNNPALGVDRYKTKSRDRFVQPGDEFERLAASIECEPDQTIRDFFWMCIFTGARRTNIQMMRWEEIDFITQTWKIPLTKNGDSHTVSLTEEALAILSIRKLQQTSEWVFPSPRLKGRPLVCPKAAWRRALARAGIKNLRIHDLRRTLASLMAIQGASQFVIGKTLGHKSVAATAIYARLTQAPVREAMQRATQLMPRAASSSLSPDS